MSTTAVTLRIAYPATGHVAIYEHATITGALRRLGELATEQAFTIEATGALSFVLMSGERAEARVTIVDGRLAGK